MARRGVQDWRPEVEHLEAGQGLVEYALIILLIALVVIVALTMFGTQIAATYERITASLAV